MSDHFIAYYISSHGFGHLTRSLAIIEQILRKTAYSVCIVSGVAQNSFARLYLKGFGKRVVFFDSTTDIGLINVSGGLRVDKDLLEKELQSFVGMWDVIVNEQCERLRKIAPELILSDVSALAFLAGEALGVKSIGISNFTWADQYEYLGIDKDIVRRYRENYEKCDFFIRYPMALELKGLTCPVRDIGFISRQISRERIKEIRKGKTSVLFVGIGKASALEKVRIRGFKGTIYMTEGLEIEAEGSEIVRLPNETGDTQNYVAASDYVITKAGWSSVAEALIGHRKTCLIERDNVLEDINTVNELKSKGLAISIKEEETKDIDFERLEPKFEEIDLTKLNNIENDIDSVIGLIGITS